MPEFEEPPASVPDPNEFDREDADIDDRLEFRAAFSETLTQHGYPDTLVLARERAEDVFHDRRLKILDHLEEQNPESVRALAQELDYDKGVVSRDLQALAKIDVIEYEDTGRSKAPRLKHNHVVVEPIV
ncbi:regulatory protein, arsR family [Natronoarchaeum philippinense]|uniref:Regulatory protein, arsR family n=1 Tax=Natronoarchaeum philippinense TaxID=558529 RepID=A0A285P9D7_NATPI|nr:helix-turn-helix domain-containing protein [Natronoarchaeum philippinense]SNZ18342.1 regulatory protein, arsR family [Natronoarchaeum philippinense]